MPNTNDRLWCAAVHDCAGPDEAALSANGAQVLNTCPRLTDVTLAFTNANPDQRPLVGDVVTCTPNGWNDEEGETPHVPLRVAAERLAHPGPDRGDAHRDAHDGPRSLSCGAAPVDSHNDSCNLYLSASMVVDNAAPTIRTVVYEPPIIYTDTDVVCT
ncbi:MAG: hypothetical protein M5U09_30450 [Gammaproteobacteria bacterium]|nr:hypothetical protein [Gammaproteobacteria bacterium]